MRRQMVTTMYNNNNYWTRLSKVLRNQTVKNRRLVNNFPLHAGIDALPPDFRDLKTAINSPRFGVRFINIDKKFLTDRWP